MTLKSGAQGWVVVFDASYFSSTDVPMSCAQLTIMIYQHLATGARLHRLVPLPLGRRQRGERGAHVGEEGGTAGARGLG